MDTAFKVNSFTINENQSSIFLGTNSGELLCMNPDDLNVTCREQSNNGDIYALAAHPNQPLVACMGMDNYVSLWDVSNPSKLKLIDRFSLRNVSPWNDVIEVPRHASQSQALCFHPKLSRIATRSPSSAIVELDYSNGSIELIHCSRFHELEDLTTLRYVQDGSKLISAALGSVVLSENGLVLDNWRLANVNLHWFEPVGKDIYLVASDSRCVIRFDLSIGEVLVTGPILTRDDLEHVTYNPTSGRAFVAGFDRNVYEINPLTCESKGVIFTAPFKMRWIKTLRREPDIAFLQCFDGGIYKVNFNDKHIVHMVRNTPPAIWTACNLSDGSIVLTGEGDEISKIAYKFCDFTRTPQFCTVSQVSKGSSKSYTKRMVSIADGRLWLGQTSGHLILCIGEKHKVFANLGCAIRDLAITKCGERILACLENGILYSIDTNTGSLIASWQSDKNLPIWAIAIHPDQNMVVAGERAGHLIFIDPLTCSVIKIGPRSGRVKRIKWLDSDTLLYNFADKVYRYKLSTDQSEQLVTSCVNTVEDFIWDKTYRYLVLVTYNTDIVLCDLDTGEKLFISADQMDYSKGLIWLKNNESTVYPLDFITFGRSGTAHLFRIHNNKCVAMGPILPAILTQRYQVGCSEELLHD